MNRQGWLIAGGLVVAAGVLVFALVQISGDDGPKPRVRSGESASGGTGRTGEGQPRDSGGPSTDHEDRPANERPGTDPGPEPEAAAPAVALGKLPPVQASLAERAEDDLRLDDLPGLPDAISAKERELHSEIYRLWGMTEDSTDGEFAGQFHRAETLLERMYEDVGDDASAKKALGERNTKLRELMAKRIPY